MGGLGEGAGVRGASPCPHHPEGGGFRLTAVRTFHLTPLSQVSGATCLQPASKTACTGPLNPASSGTAGLRIRPAWVGAWAFCRREVGSQLGVTLRHCGLQLLAF